MKIDTDVPNPRLDIDAAAPHFSATLGKVKDGLARFLALRLSLMVFLRVGPAVALLFVALRFAGVSWASATLWAGGSLLCAAVAFIWAWLHQPTRMMAARWIDAKIQKHDLYAAALSSSRTGFGSVVVAIAETDARERPLPVMPWKRLVRPGLAALAISAASVGFLLFVGSPFGTDSGRTPGEVASSLGSLQKTSIEDNPAESLPALTPGDLGKQLFPGSADKASQVASAILSGDSLALEDLIRQSTSHDANDPQGEDSPKSPSEQAGNNSDAAKQARTALQKQSSPPGGGENPNQRQYQNPNTPRQGNQGQGGSGKQESGGDGNKPGSGQGTPNRSGENGTGEQGKSGQGGENDPGDHSNSWGNGTGNEKRFDPSGGKSSPAIASLEAKQSWPYFEVLVGGGEAGTSLRSVLPDSARAAESAVSRTNVPMEYESAVRSYFLALSQATAAQTSSQETTP